MNNPAWMNTNTDINNVDTTPARTQAPQDTGGVSYRLSTTDGPPGTVTVSGRLRRVGAHGVLAHLPPDVHERLTRAVKGGATSAAILALIVYALDQLEAERVHMTVLAH